MTPILAFACASLTFALGDFIARKSKGYFSTFLTAIIIFVLFGSVFKLFPGDMIQLSGLDSIIPTFGMALILTNLGSSLNLNDLKNEWKTIVVSLGGIIGVVIACATLGQLIFGRVHALSAIAPISGGIVAVMIAGEAAVSAGFPEISQFLATVMAVQMLVGLPIASFCLKKSSLKYVDDGKLNTMQTTGAKRIDIAFLQKYTSKFDFPTFHFGMLALLAVGADFVSSSIGLNKTLAYLILGLVGASIGFIKPNALKFAGGDGIMLLATYTYTAKTFLTMTFQELLSILVPVFGLLIIGAIGVIIFGSLVGLLFKWDIYLSIATSISCMFGYPITYAVAMEISDTTALEKNLSDEDKQKLVDHLMPKMIIAGVTSVSVASVVLAGIIAPIIFA